ncbi:MAG: histidinol-phosphate transaminase [Betaproteobacteria bacterium]|nr:MAG: histidinol-phosphate transaminase [Betaproteobacteria bacterium]
MTGPSPFPSPRLRGEGNATSAELVARVVRPEIRALSAYVVAKAEGMIKLDAMENPYALPGPVRARLDAALSHVAVNRYPDGGADAAKAALRQALGISDRQAVLLGNGSDELIQIITSALARPGAVMLAPEPSFVMYSMNALYAGMRFVGVPLSADFSLDLPAMRAAIEREQPSLVFIAYPNNPTGNLFAAGDVEAVLRVAPGLVVVDEAYYAFAEASFLPRIAEYPNLLVLRTVSKVGLAGIRLGYAVAAPEWIAELNKVRAPYNVNALTQAGAVALFADTGWIAEQASAIRAERARLEAALRRLPETTVFPSQTNFVLVRVADAKAMFDGLKAQRILVKNVHGWHPLLANCLRITVGTPEENDLLLAACTELCR